MKKLCKSQVDRKISGVCGGIGEYFGVDSTLVRLILVLIALVSAGVPVVIFYLVAAVLMPEGM